MMMEQRQTKTLSKAESLAMLKNLLYVSIISADNDEYSEDVKQEIISRYDKYNYDSVDWRYVLEPLGDDMYKYIEILES